MPSRKRKYLVYILKCNTENKYYVGITANFQRRLARHFKGSTKFTRDNGVQYVVAIFPEIGFVSKDFILETELKYVYKVWQAKHIEDLITFMFRARFGYHNVYGM